ncbi:hypothetical protein TNIN_448671 [Trichonephila inaurata madagascariensis]|uniref:Uncharacterized protein n=1 Tax=Trichonephila inaurata madagascariensis TaxID=2747483 RepID=A0A8X6XL09_9ARAC|nr:hypothetical protein TNIN_448671 [Trichonephila inaurata madagascariensis]
MQHLTGKSAYHLVEGGEKIRKNKANKQLIFLRLSFLRFKLSKFESLQQNSANASFTGELAPFNLGLLLRFPFADDSGGSSTETWKKSSARNHLRVDEAGCSPKSGG